MSDAAIALPGQLASPGIANDVPTRAELRHRNVDAVNPARIAQRIRAARLRAKLTQTQVAAGCGPGMERTHISRAESGTHGLSLDVLARIATAIGVPVTSLLEDET